MKIPACWVVRMRPGDRILKSYSEARRSAMLSCLYDAPSGVGGIRIECMNCGVTRMIDLPNCLLQPYDMNVIIDSHELLL